MNRKAFIVVLIMLVLFSINFCVAQEMDNTTIVDLNSTTSDAELLSVSEEIVNETPLQAAAPKADTKINVESTTEFDVIGDYFKVKLSDGNGKAIGNTKVTFTVSGKTYDKTTNGNGIASLQLRLNDGTYKITTKFAGNSNYKASSLTTTVTMTNTRVVEVGLSNSEIQKIIDNAKVNNVILFKGSSYSDINLVVTKSLTLLSNSKTALSSSSGPVITVKGKEASLTTVKGFKIKSEGNGIVVNNADYVKIISNVVSGGGNGIVVTGTKYVNITNNDVVNNAKSGVILADSSSSYIFNNRISGNGVNGIGVAKSSNVYIHGNTIKNNQRNGICLDKTIDGVNYGAGPEKVYINKNTVSNNEYDGILVQNAGNGLSIKSNTVSSNKENGISLAHVGDNTIQSNVISENWANGIKFFDSYVKPKNQEISYNAIFSNIHMDVEAKDTYYQDTGNRLDVGDNWYTDHGGICPKIQTNNIKFVVKQVGPNQFQASFLDSNGNVASLLPDRTLNYKTNNGKTISITVKGGIAVFNVDAKDGDIVSADVDKSVRDNTYDSATPQSRAENGKSPSYSYPDIPNYQIYEDIDNNGNIEEDYNEETETPNGNGGTGNGGTGNEGTGNGGNGQYPQGGNSNDGNGTHSQRAAPSSNSNNPVNDVVQSYQDEVSASQASASQSGSGGAGESSSEPQSVVKQILLEEEDFFRVTGISFIVLLIILTVGFYYCDDIKDMNSKR